jgi:hypothetical protein
VDWARHIEQTLADHGGLATRQQLLARVPRTVLDGYVGRRFLDRVFPRVYCRAGRHRDDRLVLRAALAHVGPGAALSHLTALHLHGAHPLTRPLHLTVDHDTRRAGARDLVVHRRLRFDVASEQCTVRAGLPVTALPRSLVDSWPLLSRVERRPLLLETVRRRRTTAHALRAALAERPNVAGHAALAQTIELIADGCQSELEVMGVLTVFTHRSLPRGIGQYRIPLPDGVAVHADRAWPEVKLAVEMDGARFHTSPEDRQRDLARDAALAAIGWVVLRFTYAEVLRDPDGVRARVLAVHRMRTSQLAAG